MHAAVGESVPWTRIVSSPLRAAVHLPKRWPARTACRWRVDERLKEVGFGVWEGKSAAEIEADAPGTLARFKADPVHARPQAPSRWPRFMRGWPRRSTTCLRSMPASMCCWSGTPG
jgi:alpha-ribazole phosphatase